MRGAEGVVDVDVAEPAQRGAEGGDLVGVRLEAGAVLLLDLALLLDVEAEVLEQQDLAGLERGGGGLGDGADAILGEGDGAAQQALELGGDGAQRELVDALAVGTAEVRHQDDAGAGVQDVADARERRLDALGVRDGARLLVLGDVEVDAHEDALAVEVAEFAEGEDGHGGKDSGGRGLGEKGELGKKRSGAGSGGSRKQNRRPGRVACRAEPGRSLRAWPRPWSGARRRGWSSPTRCRTS